MDSRALKARLCSLTPQERVVLSWRCKGLTVAETAKQLVVAESTIYFHLGNIYEKLNLTHLGRYQRGQVLGGTICPLLDEMDQEASGGSTPQVVYPLPSGHGEGAQPSQSVLDLVRLDDKAVVARRQLVTLLLLALAAFVVTLLGIGIYLLVLRPIPTVVIDYPTEGGRVTTTSDCIGEVRGHITGSPLPGSSVDWAIQTDRWYPQAPGEIEPDGSFRLRGYFGGQDGGYPHDVRVELVELRFLRRAAVMVHGVVRDNPCTIR